MYNSRILRFVFSALATFLFVTSLSAQKNKRLVNKNIDEAKTIIKSGKNFDKAEKLMTDLLNDSINQSNIKIYATWFNTVKCQYDAANEKLYLKQKYDTAAFYNLTRHMQDVAIKLDSLDAAPDKKGRVRPSYRKDHAALLHALRINIYYGGTWHVRKEGYQSAYAFFDDYLKAEHLPFYADYRYGQTDALLMPAAYWATFCGFKLKDPERTLKHSQLALKDSTKAQFTLQYISEAYKMQHNDSAYSATLEKGFNLYPDYPYFFPRLAELRSSQKRYNDVLTICDKGLTVNPTNTLFLIAKSVALLNMERYDECIETSKHIIEQNDTLPEPYFNIATCYLNEALMVEQQNEPRKNRLILSTLYKSALPYMENYRRLVPDDKKRWAPALYRIYFNLNMGKQFEEIDQLLRK